MPDNDDGNADKPQEPISRPIKSNRLSKFEGIIISRERVFDVLATVITAIFTVVLALSTVLLWKETKDLRDFAQQQSEDMKASIAEAARAANAMEGVAKAVAASAKAADESVSLYRDSFARQSRAYLSVGFFGAIPQNKDTGYRYDVRMTLQNVGNTPAYNVGANIYADVLPYPLPADFKIPEFNPAMSGGTNTIGPHQNMLLTGIAPRIYPDDDAQEAEHGIKKLLYVYGTVVYEDAFGVSRHTSFCQMVLWASGGNHMTRNYGNYNESN